MKTIFRGLSVSLLALAAAGCSTPNPTALDKPGDVPSAFTAPVAKEAPIWPDVAWWTNFKADELPALEETAQKQNLDLAAADARVLESEALNETAFASLLPTLNLQGSAQRSARNSSNSGFTTTPVIGTSTGTTTSGTTTGTTTTGGTTTGTTITGGTTTGTTTTTTGSGGFTTATTDSYTAGLSASYVLDFWGANQDRLRQARENLRAARYAETIVGLTSEASVANQYFTILALRQRITIARQNIDASNRILTVVQAKVTNGVSSNLDLAQEQATVATQQARLPALIEQEREARYALAVLLGRAPEGFDVKAQSLSGIVSPTVQPGLPSEFLLRNPTVAQAEAQLYALHANVDAARAAFFPQIGLTGSAGYSSAIVGSLINPAGFAWSVGASLLQSIFDGGRLAAQDDLAKAQQTESIALYRRAVFTAFSNVETALGQVSGDSDQLVALTEEVRASTEAFRIAELQYREGTIDILSLLQAQQQLFTAQDSLVTTQQARLIADVNLYMTLGGGWSQQASDAAYQPQLDWWPL